MMAVRHRGSESSFTGPQQRATGGNRSFEAIQLGPASGVKGLPNTKAIRLGGWPCDLGSEAGRASLLEGRDGAGLVVVDVENGVELGQLEQVMDLLGEFQQLERSSLILRRGKCAHEFAQP